MSNSPRSIVVLIPACNEALHLPRTLACVASQQLPGDVSVEVIVLENGSTDGTFEAARDWIHSQSPGPMRFHVESVPARGKSPALNHGLERYPAPVHILLDADLLLSPDLFRTYLGKLEDPAVRIVGIRGRPSEEPSPDTLLGRFLRHWQAKIEVCSRSTAFMPTGGCLAVRFPPGLRLFEDTRSEDYGLIFEMIHRHGWESLAIVKGPRLQYHTPATWTDLLEQRARWRLGGSELIHRHPHLAPIRDQLRSRQESSGTDAGLRAILKAEGWTDRNFVEVDVMQRMIVEQAAHLLARGGSPQDWASPQTTKCAPVITVPDPGLADEGLILAAGVGNFAAALRALKGGSDPTPAGHDGRTALHAAIAGRHASLAALLLLHGADFRVTDREGRAPLGPECAPPDLLHAVRQRYRRIRREPGVQDRPIPEGVAPAVAEFRSRGILKISGLIKPPRLEKLRRAFSGFIRRMQALERSGQGGKRSYEEEEHIWQIDRGYVTNNAFRDNPALVRLCSEPGLLAIVDHYLGGEGFVQRGTGMRYLPLDAATDSMFDWHHDMEESRVKMMVLLTDILPGDQTMSFAVGSHALHHPLEMFSKNSCPLEYLRAQLGEVEIVDTVGAAGDVYLFDSNGAHKGNRRADAPVRDAYFVEFTVDPSDVWGGSIPPRALEGLAGRHPFGRMLQTPRRWTIARQNRTQPTWIEDLPHVERWCTDRITRP